MDPLPPLANLIGGEWRPAAGGETFSKRNPFDPGRVLAEIPLSGPEDVTEAVTAAAEAADAWGLTQGQQRGALLAEVADRLESEAELISATITAEIGKPRREAQAETQRAVSILRFFSGEAWGAKGELFEQGSDGVVWTMRRPLGAVGLIAPWNFPIAIPVWKLAPALAYGNTAVLKLASDAPLTGLHLARLFAEAESASGVVNVINGPGARCGAALIEHPAIRAVSFTGSEQVGLAVRDLATTRGVRTQLELSGHSPMIVLPDCDLDAAVEGAFRGAFWSQGQKCTATRRIYVHTQVYDRFREEMIARIEAARVGDPADPETEIGPLVNEKQMRMVLSAIERTRDEGGRLLAGGSRAGGPGYVVPPTLFEGLADDALLSKEEVFGPVAALYRVADVEEAIARANRSRFGLSASIYTSSLAAARRFGRELEAGVLHINSPTAGAEPHVPFGGLKTSGWGPHEQGRSAIEFFTDLITVYENA